VRVPFARTEPELVAAAGLLGRAWRGEPGPVEPVDDGVVL
jgi:hypothetical protein